MKFYNAGAGNPRRVRIFIAEKGLNIPRVDIDFSKKDNQTSEFLKLNSLGEVPILELDDGTAISESTAICRYLESQHPDPALFGTNNKEIAHIEMWDRRIEFHIFAVMSNIVRHEVEFFADKVEQVPEYAATQRRYIHKKWAWLNSEMADGRPYIAGNSFSVADITAMAALMASDWLKVGPKPELEHVSRWSEVVRNRDSWSA